MAMAMESGEKSRYTDVSNEPVERLLSPIRGYENKPLLPLAETIKFVSGFFNCIEDCVYVALHNCRDPADNLTQEESASIHLYTMQFHGGPSLYQLLNQALRDENRDQLIPWFSYLKLFLTAIYKLPSESRIVWRGVKGIDLSSKYQKGEKIAWWGVSSCTTQIEVLKANTFLGNNGLRTLFSIQCINGKSIINHSYYKSKEEEVILMPGSYFEVIGQLNPASELYIIQLNEIMPPVTFVQPPFAKSTPVNPSPVNQQSDTHPQATSNTTWQNAISNFFTKLLPLQSDATWKQNGITIAGGNGRGDRLNQFNCPNGISIDNDQTIYVADLWNHRIVEWKRNGTEGRIVAGGNGQGYQLNQLNNPTDVIIDEETNSLIIADCGNRRVMRWSRQNKANGEVVIADIGCSSLTMTKDGSLYVSNCDKDEVRRWKRGERGKGTIVAGGSELGEYDLTDYSILLNGLNSVFVDEDESVYISDWKNHRVMKWMKGAKEGIVVAGGNGRSHSLKELSYPAGVLVDQLGHIYVAEWGNHRVTRWCQGAKEGTIVLGGHGAGQRSNQFYGPRGLAFDRQGNLYVAEWRSHRIQKFEVE